MGPRESISSYSSTNKTREHCINVKMRKKKDLSTRKYQTLLLNTIHKRNDTSNKLNEE